MPDSILALSGLDSGVVAGLGDGYVQIFTAASLERVARSHAVVPLVTFAAHAGAVNAVHAAAVGEGILGCATGGDDGVVRLWRARTAPGAAAELSAVLGGAPNGEGAQPDSIASLMISADADLVAAGDARGGIFLWSAAAALQGHRGAAAPPGAAAPAAEQVPPSSSALAGSKRPRPAAAAPPAAGRGGGPPPAARLRPAAAARPGGRKRLGPRLRGLPRPPLRPATEVRALAPAPGAPQRPPRRSAQVCHRDPAGAAPPGRAAPSRG